MTRSIQILMTILILFSSCGDKINKRDDGIQINADIAKKLPSNTSLTSYSLPDTTVKILWRDKEYDKELKDTFSSTFINEDYCKTISDPARAALGYVTTFIGNECWWDGKAKDDRSNLKCKLLSSLNLDYQCSEKHLSFLRQWFRDDKKALENLDNCPTTPYTATIQDNFDEIVLIIKGNQISVWFAASGVNVREGQSWSWTETDHFQIENDIIQLVQIDKSEIKPEDF